MRLTPFFAPLALLLAACGGSTAVTVLAGEDGGPPRDGGPGLDGGACGGPAPDLGCTGCCGGAARPPVCSDGKWTCAACTLACVLDAGTDSGHDAGTLACGTETCDPSTEYCWVVGGGAQPLDGGSNMTYTCTPLPASCHGAATCACVEADGGANGCPCTAAGDAVTVECLYP